MLVLFFFTTSLVSCQKKDDESYDLFGVDVLADAPFTLELMLNGKDVDPPASSSTYPLGGYETAHWITAVPGSVMLCKVVYTGNVPTFKVTYVTPTPLDTSKMIGTPQNLGNGKYEIDLTYTIPN